MIAKAPSHCRHRSVRPKLLRIRVRAASDEQQFNVDSPRTPMRSALGVELHHNISTEPQFTSCKVERHPMETHSEPWWASRSGLARYCVSSPARSQPPIRSLSRRIDSNNGGELSRTVPFSSTRMLDVVVWMELDGQLPTICHSSLVGN